MLKVWSKEKAAAWYADSPWCIGFNYVPSTAVNSVQMWQDADFDKPVIAREMERAAQMGYNSVRVFLSYVVWEADGQRFLDNFNWFVRLCADNRISVMPNLFDDCAFGKSEPVVGPQPEPVPGVHNSRWVPSPGFRCADDPAAQVRLREFVLAVVGAHRTDPGILAWDVYNEPGNSDRGNESLPLLVNAFRWTREAEPKQPLTAGIWKYDDSSEYHACLELSDVVSFHSYNSTYALMEIAGKLAAQEKPLLLTEWLHRPNGDTLLKHLPMLRSAKIGCWHWGLFQGKTQTNLHWTTMAGNPDPNPMLWQHDILREDGTPYDEAEVRLIRELSER